jgi:hypothetical protein
MVKENIAKEKKSKVTIPVPRYRQVDVASLGRGRRGKHHELVDGVMVELVNLPSGSALEIPLGEAGGVGLANLRSALHRASEAAGLHIETVSRDGKLYVWKGTPSR